jgi:HlyD family secretion protein
MTAHPRPRIRGWQILLLLCAVVVIGSVAYANRRKLVEVGVGSPGYRDLANAVETGGTVVPLEEFPARANFAGIVTNIYVHVGEKVRPGQLLLTMKDQYALARLENARAALESAEIGEQDAKNNGSAEEKLSYAANRQRAVEEQKAAAAALATLRQLHRRGSVSDAELAVGTQRLQTATANLRAMDEKEKHRYSAQDLTRWKVKVAAAKASVAAEKVSYNNANITSPICGTVFVIPVARYDFVPMGSDLIRVADLTKIQVHADFDEADIARLGSNQPVQIHWDGRPDRTWHGHVVHAPMAVTEEGPRDVGQCTIAVDDADGDLPADSHVTVTVTIATHRHVLAIPRDALRTDGENRFVYRVVDGRLAKTAVQVGLVNLYQAEILRGLSSNDIIVLRVRNGTLADHERVSIVR